MYNKEYWKIIMENDLYNDIIAKNKCKFLEKYNPETTSLDTNTGGEFVVYNKDDIDKINELGKIYLYKKNVYMINNLNPSFHPSKTLDK